MGAYEVFLVIIFSVLAIVFVWNSIKLFKQAFGRKDKNKRKSARKKAFLLMAFGLIFILCALYVIFRASWLFFIVFLIGCMAVAYAVGSGLGENMRKH